jgi:hypothetical protein
MQEQHNAKRHLILNIYVQQSSDCAEFTRLGVAFLPSCIAQQTPLREWPDHLLFAGVAGLNDRAHIILLKELLSIDQNEWNVL